MSDKKVIITRMRAPIERVEVRFGKGGGVYASMEIRPNGHEPETWVASFLDWTTTLNHGQLALVRGALTELLGESEVYEVVDKVEQPLPQQQTCQCKDGWHGLDCGLNTYPGFGQVQREPLKECRDCNTKSNSAASFCYHCGSKL